MRLKQEEEPSSHMQELKVLEMATTNKPKQVYKYNLNRCRTFIEKTL
jgi:hypothetical protein